MEKEGLIEGLDKTKVELIVKNPDDNMVDFDIGMFFRYISSRIFSLFLVLLVGALVAVIICTVYFFSGNEYKGEASLIYTLNFSGIDNGKNPLGGEYNPNEVISVEVLSSAMEISGLNSINDKITPDDLRQNITVQGITPHDAMDRILAVNEIIQKDPTRIMDLQEIEYHPFQFKITMQLPKIWNISDSQATQFITTLIECYSEWFVSTYGGYRLFTSIDNELLSDSYDYINQIEVCESKTASIQSYLRDMASSEPDFKSLSTGMSFNDLLSQIELIRNVDISDMTAIINTFSLTKDKARLLAIYNSRLIDLKFALEADQQTVAALEKAITEYERPQTSFIMPSYGSGDDSSSLYQSSDYKEYDSLTQQKISANKAVIETQKQIDILENRIDRLKNNSTISPAEREQYSTDVNNGIEKISQSINDITDTTNSLMGEYYKTYKYKNAVKVSLAAMFSSESKLKFTAVLFVGIIGGVCFIAFVVIAIQSFFYVNKKQRAQIGSTYKM